MCVRCRQGCNVMSQGVVSCVSVSSETLPVFVSHLRRDCNGSSWPVEIIGEHRKAHQPGNTWGEDNSSWYPFNNFRLLDIIGCCICKSSVLVEDIKWKIISGFFFLFDTNGLVNSLNKIKKKYIYKWSNCIFNCIIVSDYLDLWLLTSSPINHSVFTALHIYSALVTSWIGNTVVVRDIYMLVNT